MMWKTNGIRNKNIASIALLTTALLTVVFPTAASATRLESSEPAVKQVSPAIVARMEDLTVRKAARTDQGTVFVSKVAVLPETPVPVKVGLGRTCDDPWYELSGIQFITCLFM